MDANTAATIVQVCFGAAITVLFGAAVGHLKDLSRSVRQLNTDFAVMLEKFSQHEKRLDIHDKKIAVLENPVWSST